MRVSEKDAEALPSPREAAQAQRLWERRRALLARAGALEAAAEAELQQQGTVKAWVVFNSVRQARAVHKRLSPSLVDALCCSCTVSHFKRFRGVYVLGVKQAPKPSSILWENLGQGCCMYTACQAFTGLVCLALLVGCGAAVHYVRAEVVPRAVEAGLNALVPFLVPATAFLLQLLLSAAVQGLAVALEGHHTRDDRDVSIFWRLVLCLFFNSLGMLYILHAQAPLLPPTPAPTWAIDGNYMQFSFNFLRPLSPGWYAEVAVPVLLLQVGNVLLPHTFLALRALRRCCLRGCLNKAPCCAYTSQRALNTTLAGAPFPAAERYAHLFASFLVCYTLSLGVPLLLLVGSAVAGVFYWVELHALSHLYARPAAVSAALPRTVALALPLCMAVHAAASMWLLSGTALPAGFLEPPGLLRTSFYGCLALFAFAVGCNVWDALGSAKDYLLCVRKDRWLLCIKIKPPAAGGMGEDEAVNFWAIEEADALSSLRDNYRDALRTNFLTDIRSYDIHDNPEYLFAFGQPPQQRAYVDWAAPDPGPPERTLTLPPKEHKTESAVLKHAFEINSLKTLEAMVPNEATRIALYGGGLMDNEAKITKPSRTGVVGEGRTGLVMGKKAERIHAPELAFDAAGEGLGAAAAAAAPAAAAAQGVGNVSLSKSNPNARLRMDAAAPEFREDATAGITRSVYRAPGAVDDKVVIFTRGEEPRRPAPQHVVQPHRHLAHKGKGRGIAIAIPLPGAPPGPLAAASPSPELSSLTTV